jgi:ribokinase
MPAGNKVNGKKATFQPDLVVVGGANTDYFIKGNRLPEKGKSAPGERFESQPGGKGINQAIGAARLGARVALVAMMGNDLRAREILERLEAEGVDTRHVSRTDNVPTGATLIMIGEEGQTTRMWVAGANVLLLPSVVEDASAPLRSARLVLAQLEVPSASVMRAFELAREHPIPTMLDDDPAIPLTDAMMALIDAIRVDLDAEQVISGAAVTDHDAAIAVAASLIHRGARIVALQSPDDGNMVVTPEAAYSFPPVSVVPIDRTGAGDAFSAAFAVALLEGKPLEQAGFFANAAAAWATTRIGAVAGLPTRNELDAFVASHA